MSTISRIFRKIVDSYVVDYYKMNPEWMRDGDSQFAAHTMLRIMRRR